MSEEYLIEQQLHSNATELISVGVHNAVCIAFKKLGLQPKKDYQSGEVKTDEMGVPIMEERCHIEFEVDEADAFGKKKTIRRWMVLAISNEKHALRCMWESWKGSPISADADGYARLKPSEIIGKSAKLQILHKEKQDKTLKHVIDKVWPAEVEYVPQHAIDYSLDPSVSA